MNNCNCQPQSSRPAVPTPYTKQFACNQELAMAYVPWQQADSDEQYANEPVPAFRLD